MESAIAAAEIQQLVVDTLSPSQHSPASPPSTWLECFAVVTFDLEIGQTLDCVYPEKTFEKTHLTDICFHSFPDCSDTVGDAVHCFRLRIDGAAIPSHAESQFQYGASFFRRQRDPSKKRGFFQESVVVLSSLPYFGAFKKIVSCVAPRYFEHGKGVLDAAWTNLCQWEEPVPGEAYQLPLLGEMLRVCLPCHSSPASPQQSPSRQVSLVRSRSAETFTKAAQRQAEQPGGASGFYGLPSEYSMAPPGDEDSPSESAMSRTNSEPGPSEGPEEPTVTDIFEAAHLQRPGLFQDINLYSCFRSLLPSLWTLWELMLTGQPLVVMAPNPSTCSESVLGLASLISPLPYQADFRPFFTIHNLDFKHFTRGQGFPFGLLGVTNQFFLKAAAWPNLLNLPGLGLAVGSGLVGEAAASLQTPLRPALPANRTVLSQLLPGTPSTEATAIINNEILRRHFMELTEAFLTPFEDFFTVQGLGSNSPMLRPFSKPPSLRPFSPSEFVKHLQTFTHTSDLKTLKTKRVVQLYEGFIRSVHFVPWFEQRRSDGERALRDSWRHARYNANIKRLLQGLRDVEMVDLYVKVAEALHEECVREDVNMKMRRRLQEQLDEIMLALPEQLKAVVQAKVKSTSSRSPRQNS